jgi:hypothetical protein
MKKWVYVTGFIFAAALLGFTVFKLDNREIPDAFLYLFSLAAFAFFFMLAFYALQQRRK